MSSKLVKNDPNKEGWETANFPIVCETCLGANPYIRMTRAQFDKECKVCARPFTVFRWKPGPRARYKKTEVCQTCSKLKNVCQVCLLDLKYGLPVQVRDHAREGKDSIPVSDVNREYYADQAEKAIEASGKFGASETGEDFQFLNRLARRTPYYKRNEAQICSFFIRGECNRGATCPYRHVNPEEEHDPDLASQNFKDRYYGMNDPVAQKILNGKAKKMKEMVPPADKLVKTLWLGGIYPPIDEKDIRDQLYSYGEIYTVKIVPTSHCAFVTFSERSSAEDAAKSLWNGFKLRGMPVSIDWGKPQTALEVPQPPAGVTATASPLPPPGAPPPPGSSALYYPSMDPAQFGSKVAPHQGSTSSATQPPPPSGPPPPRSFRPPMINPAP
eukprot:CAMPEP_0201479720 /NCGR_PEP_ID=MMETSP0151_2-20130828/4368_1 /ASSEMBLY_ACC=CAM_ASM_000257 /TAXON_ID=200890 /ORGANISM="Paramoeba atlantica, Strain 621/1 / CCAP 1560/9" /LENGTH=385 /DNA_ID=CAMNT_0047861333 /DNA_START=8 /DNA_END=1165 /DNA_ORIENTATION=+